MQHYWQALIEPLLHVLQPSQVLEVGAGRGELSRLLLDASATAAPRLLVSDARPMFDHEQWQRGNESRFAFSPVSMLPAIEACDGRADVVFLKGEPNWYAVLNALRLLERQARPRRGHFPVVLISDTAWPYGRRDAYPDPERVPASHRQPHATQGVRPECRQLVAQGGLHPQRAHALTEHSLRNGVASAVEDFLAETPLRLMRFDWAAFGGLTLLAPATLVKDKPALAALLREFETTPRVTQWMASIESSRTLAEVAASERSHELQALRRTHADQVERLAARAMAADQAAGRASDRVAELESQLVAVQQEAKQHLAQGVALRSDLQLRQEQQEAEARFIQGEFARRDALLRERQAQRDAALAEVERWKTQAASAAAAYADERGQWQAREDRFVQRASEGEAALARAQAQVAALAAAHDVQRDDWQAQEARLLRLASERDAEWTRAQAELQALHDERDRLRLDREAQAATLQAQRDGALDELHAQQAQITAANQLHAKDRDAWQAREADLTRFASARAAELAAAQAQVRTLRDQLVGEQGRYARALDRIAAVERRAAGGARKVTEAVKVLRGAAEAQATARTGQGEWGVAAAMARALVDHDRRSGAGALRLARVSIARWRKHGVEGAVERLKKEYQKLAAEQGLPLLASTRDQRVRMTEQLERGLAMAIDGCERLQAPAPESITGASVAPTLPSPASAGATASASAHSSVGRIETVASRPMAERPAPTTTAVAVAAPPVKRVAADKPKLRATALVLTWDVGHNPLGRSYMLGEVLQRVVRNVVMVGFQFPRYGSDVWEPVRDGALPVISLPGEDMPQFLASLERIAERMQPDIVIACKPRLPSLQLGALVKQRFGCPLVVDIDDHELSFFEGAKELTIEELSAMSAGSAAAQTEPFGSTWTRLAQHLCKYADQRIVSNVALQREFGGQIVAHVRDESVFDPTRFDRRDVRRKYGVQEDAKIVLFFGTPRHHKGIDALAQAVAAIDDRAFRLLVVGTTTDRSVTAKLEKIAPGRIDFLPNQPFAAVPEIVSMADVICLPQDEAHPISQFQLPAKAIDAVAMGVPLLVTRTPPLQMLIDDGVATAVDRHDLANAIVRAAGRRTDRAHASTVRQRFLDRYSYAAAAKMLRTMIEGALARKPSPMPDLPALIANERRVLGVSPVSEVARRETGVDIVVFWKQNDTGMYGRRSDMVIDYLASRKDVRRVLVFDAPTSEFDLQRRLENAKGPTQDRLIYEKTYEKVFGKLDRAKLRYNVFVYPPGVYANAQATDGRPALIDGYEKFLRGVFEREGVDPQRAVFWLYPKNYLAPQLVERFTPARIVVDVVDDHRTWPGVSAQERERLTENYRETLALADMAFTNCEPVRDTMRAFYPQVRLVPNGCDASPRREPPVGDAAYDAFAAAPGKVIGFVGNLEQKIDIELIDRLAQRFADCQIVLVGSTHANPKVRDLMRHPNVRMPGVVPYAKVGAWIARFDVAIIPHLDSEMTQSMNPLKLYVYLSHRVPVVSTEVFNVDRSSSFVKVARSHDEFVERVAETLAAGRGDAAALQELERYVADNSWAARLQPHVDELLSVAQGQHVSRMLRA